MKAPMKTASFTVRASMAQSVRWKTAADAEGCASVGSWIAEAVDAHLEHRARAGQPIPLAWRRGGFKVRYEDGREFTVRGSISRPFAIFRGDETGPDRTGRDSYVLVYLPTGRFIATVSSSKRGKILSAELARVWVRWDRPGEPAEDPAPLLQRFQREDA